MKRLSLAGMLLVLVMYITPANAMPLGSLSELAAYFPADTQIFVTARIDDDYFATLDSLIARLAEAAPDALPVVPSIRAALDDSARGLTEGEEDFEAVFRSWMGDTLALAVEDTAPLLLGNDLRLIIALSVTDRGAAETFLDTYIAPNGDYEKTQRNDDLVYEAQNEFDAHYLLRDGVMLIAPPGQTARTLNLRVRESLAESESYSTALATLPADEYNIVAYINLPEVIAPIAAFAPLALGESVPADFDLTPIIEGLGALTFGFTMVDEHSLVMDASLVVNDPTVFRDAGVPLGTLPPLDLDFATYLPQNAAFVVQDGGLGSDILVLLNSLDELSVQLEEAGAYPLLQGTRFPPYSEAELDVLRGVNLNDLLAFIRLSFKGMTGLTLEDGLLWMTGDYATYLALVPLENGGLTSDFGVINRVTDSDSARALFDGLQRAFDQGGAVYTVEEGALVLPFLSDALAEAYLVESVPEGNLLIGQNDEVFAVGTRPGVEHALNPQDGGLAATTAYQRACGAFVPGTHMLWYLSLSSLFEPMRGMLMGADANAEQIYKLFALFESMTITATSDENGTGVVRFAITLAE